jgi:chloramphenicol O-acetyltransferase
LHPSYAVFHEDDKSMSNLWTPYCDNFSDFYQSYIDDQIRFAGNHGIIAKPEMPPKNSFMIGMLPWITFTHYSPIPFATIENYFLVLQAGKFLDKEGKKMMPLSIMVYHAVAGWL